MLKLFTKKRAKIAAVITAAQMVATTAHATTASTTANLPWEGGVQRFVDSLTGPVAIGISLSAIVAVGAGMIFKGDEMGEFAKKGMQIVLVISIIVFAAQILTALIGTTGSVL